MVKTGSLFSQILSLVDREVFGRIVRDLKAEKAAKGFSWPRPGKDHYAPNLIKQFYSDCRIKRKYTLIRILTFYSIWRII